MIDEALEDDAVCYVLGKMSSADAAMFEIALSENAELRAFVAEMNNSVASIALAAPAAVPPRDLPARVLEGARKPVKPAKVSRVQWLPWALAACLAVTCAVIGIQIPLLHSEMEMLRETNYNSGLRITLLESIQQELNEKDALATMRIATLASQVDAYSKAIAVVVWDGERQRGILKLSNLPPLETGKDYQLWVIDPSYSHPVSAGVITANAEGMARADFHPTTKILEAAQFAITIESEGGSPTPKGKIILAGT